jgi:hypothetical protein
MDSSLIRKRNIQPDTYQIPKMGVQLLLLQNILYNVGSLVDANCTCLVYMIHHLICYTVLFPSLLVVITIFPVTLTMSSGPPISCLGAVLWCLVLNAGSRLWLTSRNWLFFTTVLLAIWMLLKSSPSVPNIGHLVARFIFPPATIWLLMKRLTVDSIHCHGDVFSFWSNTLLLSLAIRCSDNNCLPSRCLGMDAVVQEINLRSDSTIPAFRQHATILNRWETSKDRTGLN